MAKVIYKQGTKATYLGLAERVSTALYFCTDTKELFKGDDLYTDGLRIVSTFSELPAFVEAADGKLYFCEDTGNGYVLNSARDGWAPVFYGFDNETIGLNENGLMAVKQIPVGSVDGLEVRLQAVEQSVIAGAPIATPEKAGIVKPSSEFAVAEDGALSLSAVAIEKVTGLEDRLQNIESAQVGGVHYKGSVATFEELPKSPKQGDLYEVTADNSEWCWNGKKWFEYGSASGLKPIARADLNESQFVIDEQNKLNLIAVDAGIVKFNGAPMTESIPAMYDEKLYEVTDGLFDDTRVLYRDNEIRVMYSKDTVFEQQNVGEGGDPNSYYFGFRAYAPDGAVGFKEDLAKTISDQTLYSFVDNPTAGTDKYGRNYSIVWLPAAVLDNGEWTYFGANSSDGKFIGWYYSVEWYDANGKVISSDCIRIGLSNENCHNDDLPYYMKDFAKKSMVSEMEEAMMWQDI